MILFFLRIYWYAAVWTCVRLFLVFGLKSTTDNRPAISPYQSGVPQTKPLTANGFSPPSRQGWTRTNHFLNCSISPAIRGSGFSPGVRPCARKLYQLCRMVPFSLPASDCRRNGTIQEMVG